MEINEILNTLGIPVSTTIIVLLLSMIKIPKIEINLWQWIGKSVSNGIVGPVLERLDEVEKKVDAQGKRYDEDRAQAARGRILRFSDEIIMGQEHSKEHYRDLLSAIDTYEDYCTENPDFPNNRCLLAIQNIKDNYMKKCHDNSFVTIEKYNDLLKKEDL